MELRMRLDFRRSVAQIAVELWRPQHHPANPGFREGIKIMKRKALVIFIAAVLSASPALPGEKGDPAPSHITLQEAVQLALKHNHNVRIGAFGVDEKQHAKEVAKSSYFPSIRNDSSFMRVTDTELIEIKAGSLGVA